jgi:hypothetical protein
MQINPKFSLSYRPNPEKILSAMREKQKMPQSVQFAYEIAWRDACLHCMEQIKDTAEVVGAEKVEWQEPARTYLARVYDEIMKDNALSPFVNYEGE